MGVDRAIDITAKQRKTILALLERHLPNTAAWVYGSRAKWTSRPQSDLDLVVFATSEQSDRVFDLREAFEESNLPFRVDLFVWETVPEQFRKHIKRDHVVVCSGGKHGMEDKWAKLTPLRDLCKSVVDCHHSTPVWTDTGVIVLRNQNIRNGRLDLSEPSYTDERHYAERTRRAAPRSDDLVITREAPMGEVCMVPAGLRCCLGQRMVLLRPDPAKTVPRYLLYALQSKTVRHEIGVSEGTGSTVSNLRIPLLEALPIPSRPLPEQRAIAHILGTLDDKIELNRRMNETLEAMARALFKSWFVDFDPVRAKMAGRDTGLPKHLADLFPDRLVESELGEIPKGWEVKVLAECTDLTMGQSPPGSTYNGHGEGLPFFQGRSDFGFRYPSNRRFCTAPNRIAQPGDTLVSVRAPVGDINMAWDRCCIGRGVAALRHKSGAVSFTYYSTRTIQTALRDYEHTGTVFGAINKSQFEALRVIEPELKIVDAFDSCARPLDSRIKSNIREFLPLAAMRDSLLPKLVTGEIRLRGDR